jgi:hypothetical protein
METMTAVKWVPPVGDRTKRYAPLFSVLISFLFLLISDFDFN